MFTPNDTYYPTPPNLIRKMISKVDFYQTKTILEPSAGGGNIVEYIREYGSTTKHCQIHCIELDRNLQSVLKGKNFQVIYDDFLKFESNFKYNLLILNPPFNQDEGCKHLLKAIEIQEQYGGQIVCLLNAMTLKNDYSVYRKDLANKLDKYNAEVEFIQDGFLDAERKTNVEVALINIHIEPNKKNSVIIENLKQEEKYKSEQKQVNEIVSGNFIDRAIAQYNFEVQAGVKLINEYESILPYISREFESNSPILKLCMNDSNKYNDSTGGLVNEYIKVIRYKYWSVLFSSKEFSKMFTTDLRKQYMEKLDELKEYDFSKYNIDQIKCDMNIMLQQSLKDTIISLFDDFSSKYSYYSECKNNIYLYNGWKSNEAHRISDKRVVIPLNAFDSWDGRFRPAYYTVIEKLRDIEKVFNYLDNGRTLSEDSLDSILKRAEENNQTKKIETKYAMLDFFKKGTCHIWWKNKDLIEKMNIIGGKNKNWLPPSYGKKSYTSMSQEEKNTIDSFQGKEAYDKIMHNPNNYSINVGINLLPSALL